MGMLPPCSCCAGGAGAPGCGPQGSEGNGCGAAASEADAVPAAAFLALPREGACRRQPGDWGGQDVPEAGAGCGPAVNPSLPWAHFFPHVISLKAQRFLFPVPLTIPWTSPSLPLLPQCSTGWLGTDGTSTLLS